MSLSRPLFPKKKKGSRTTHYIKNFQKQKIADKLVKTVGITALRESFARNDGIEVP